MDLQDQEKVFLHPRTLKKQFRPKKITSGSSYLSKVLVNVIILSVLLFLSVILNVYL